MEPEEECYIISFKKLITSLIFISLIEFETKIEIKISEKIILFSIRFMSNEALRDLKVILRDNKCRVGINRIVTINGILSNNNIRINSN